MFSNEFKELFVETSLVSGFSRTKEFSRGAIEMSVIPHVVGFGIGDIIVFWEMGIVVSIV